MNEVNTTTSLTAESFMRSLAQQLAHQMGCTVEDFKFFHSSDEKPKEETA